jgi:hypothetical protein
MEVVMSEITYSLTEEEKNEGYTKKSWDGITFEVHFENGWSGGDTFFVPDYYVNNLVNILIDSGRKYTVKKHIALYV